LPVKNAKEANNKLVEVSDLDDLLDHSEEDEELIEISRYQVLNLKRRTKNAQDTDNLLSR
jgi:hypothetical protein